MKYTKPKLLKACNISEKKWKTPIFQVQHYSFASLAMPAIAGQNDHCQTKWKDHFHRLNWLDAASKKAYINMLRLSDHALTNLNF